MPVEPPQVPEWRAHAAKAQINMMTCVTDRLVRYGLVRYGLLKPACCEIVYRRNLSA